MLRFKRIDLPISLIKCYKWLSYNLWLNVRKLLTKVKAFFSLIKGNPDFVGLDTEQPLFIIWQKWRNS